MARSLCPCGAVKDSRKPCEQCGRGKQQRDDSYGSQWDRLSKAYRREHPLCEQCEKQGRVRPCSSVHHIIPVWFDPSKKLDWNNLIAVCWDCHAWLDAENDKRYGR